MSDGNGNGVIVIGKKGMRKFQIREDGKPFEIDVIAQHNFWLTIDRNFRDEKGELSGERSDELTAACWKYVKDLSGCGDITLAEALEFMARLAEEAESLKGFFVPRRSEKPSSRESTELILEE